MPVTRLGESGYGVRRAGDFSGKTPSGGGGGGAHPVGVLTRFSLDGYGARRAGSFGGKTDSGGGGGGGGGSHPVGTLTRFGLDGYGVRRASFSGKTPATDTAGFVGLFAPWLGGAGAGTASPPVQNGNAVGSGGSSLTFEEWIARHPWLRDVPIRPNWYDYPTEKAKLKREIVKAAKKKKRIERELSFANGKQDLQAKIESFNAVQEKLSTLMEFYRRAMEAYKAAEEEEESELMDLLTEML